MKERMKKKEVVKVDICSVCEIFSLLVDSLIPTE